MADIQFGIRLTADGTGFVGTVNTSTEAIERLSRASRGLAGDLRTAEQAQKTSMTAAVALGSAIGTFAVQAVQAVARWTAEMVTSRAALKDWSDETGSSVESLSALTNAAKVSGTDLGTLRFGVDRLAVALAGTDEGSQRAGKTLKMLGINARDPATAMQELAIKLNSYSDGVNKAAIANEIFGRGGVRYLALLKDLATQGDINASTTREQAEQADRFASEFARLGLELEKARNTLLNDWIPTLANAIKQFREGIEVAGGFWEAIRLFGFGLNPFKDLTSQLSTVKAELDQLLKDKETQGGFSRFVNDMFGKSFDPAIEAARKKIAYLELQLKNLFVERPGSFAAGDRIDADPRVPAPELPPRTTPRAARDKKEVDEYARAVEDLRQAFAAANLASEALFDDKKITDADKALAKLMASDKWDKLDAGQKKAVITLYQYLSGLQSSTTTHEEAAKASGRYAEQVARERDAWDEAMRDQRESTDALIRSIDLETEAIGLNSVERSRQVAIKQLQIDRAKGLIATEEEYIEQLGRINAAFDRMQEKNTLVQLAEQSRDAWRDTFQTMINLGGNFIEDFARNGSRAFRNLWEQFKSWALQALGRVAAERILVSVVGTVGAQGSAASGLASLLGPAAAGQVGSASGGGIFGNLLSAGGSLLGSGGIFSGIASTISATLATAAGNASLALGATAASAANIAAMASAALPVVGWIAAAGFALYSMFGKQGGGPKVGGFASSGDISGISGTDDSGRRWFTPSGEDRAVQALVDATTEGFDDILESFGGSVTSRGFAAGFSSDPEGTAPGNVHVGSFVNGRQVYDAALGDLGRDEAAIQQALDLHSKRALLAALQASDIPELIANVLDSVVAETASIDDVEGVVALAAAFSDLYDVLSDGDAVEDAETAWANMQRNSAQVLRDMGADLEQLARDFDGTLESTQELTQATQDYRAAVSQMLVTIRQVQGAISDMFADTITELEQVGMSPEELFAFWQGKADAAMAQLSVATSPEEIASLTESINQYIQNAFGALQQPELPANATEQERETANAQWLATQRGMAQQFIAYINQVNALAQQRLDEIYDDTASAGMTPFDTVRTAMETAANDMKAAAADQKIAATDMNTAAGIMIAAADRMSVAQIAVSVTGDGRVLVNG